MKVIGNSSYGGRRNTAGAVVLDKDSGMLEKALATNVAKAEAQKKENDANLASIANKHYKSWDNYSSDIDKKTDDIYAAYEDYLYANKGKKLNTTQQRDINRRMNEVASYANATVQKEKIWNNLMSRLQTDKTLDRDKTLANMEETMYEYDANGNKVAKPIQDVDFSNVTKWIYKPQDYKRYIRVQDTKTGFTDTANIKTASYKNDISTDREKALADNYTQLSDNLKYSFMNGESYKGLPTKYQTIDEWATAEPQNFSDYIDKNLLDEKGVTTGSTARGKIVINNGGGGKFNTLDFDGDSESRVLNIKKATGETDENDNPILVDSDMYATDYKPIVNAKINIPSKGIYIGGTSGKKSNVAGGKDLTITGVAKLPVINEKNKKSLETAVNNLTASDKQKLRGLQIELLKDISGKDVQYTEEDYQTLKEVFGDDFNKYFKEMPVFSTKENYYVDINDNAATKAYRIALTNKKNSKNVDEYIAALKKWANTPTSDFTQKKQESNLPTSGSAPTGGTVR